MLARARVRNARHILGDVRALPFDSGSFDVAICAWVLETLPDPSRALAELVRVLAPGGLLCTCFCTQPGSWEVWLRSLPVRLVVERCFGGRFLPRDFPPGNAGRAFRRLPYHRGLSTLACYRKCDQTTGAEAFHESSEDCRRARPGASVR